MKKNWLLIAIVILLVVAAGVLVAPRMSSNKVTPIATNHTHSSADGPATPAQGAKLIPAYLQQPPSRSSLAPTLAPEKFEGLTRDAYKAVREIPVTIAKLPCYCHCDRGFGHKSLYSCFEDDHAAHCAVCVNEALLALKLEKEGKTAPQIRERIVETFGN
ncbi:MAG TPA: CYCXC family (seleno)protein [Pyrinomonadaceae bacterium]|nr:CYCXC family (seleno)protein [Pyrinomonadaceae bacterium]